MTPGRPHGNRCGKRFWISETQIIALKKGWTHTDITDDKNILNAVWVDQQIPSTTEAPEQGSGEAMYLISGKQIVDLMHSVAGISPYQSEDPDDMTDYPIPDGIAILKAIRARPAQKQEIEGLWRSCPDLRSNESGDALCAMYEVCSFPNCHMSGLAVRENPEKRDLAIATAAAAKEVKF